MASGVLVQGQQPAASETKEPQALIAKHLGDKQSEWDALAAKKEPLRLLDLPVDILQSILKEVTHTNDLTSLALTHSALHALVIPHIYSRFDIVWPDANATFENRMGVDALTYGLATLVMAQDVFGEAPYQQQPRHACEACGHQNASPAQVSHRPPQIRRGNYFAQFTRKFSLGNGPADWVQEYLITKEGGKMLGTLVALAVGRMRNLEAFIWDMPTGVLRDVWLALASLGTRDDGQVCRLERVWVRWHDNQDQGPLASPPPPPPPAPAAGQPLGPQATNLPSILAGTSTSLFQIPPYPRVEFPTFSILPPLRSLSVLDIDELPYAEEMSVLIERSLGKLQELRIGIASHAQFDIWARPAEDRAPVLPPIMSSMSYQNPRPGGILGILVHRFCDAFSHQKDPHLSLMEATDGPEGDSDDPVADLVQERDDDDGSGNADEPISTSEINQLGVLLSAHNIQEVEDPDATPVPASKRTGAGPVPVSQPHQIHGATDPFQDSPTTPARKLHLETLEVERVYLSITVLSRALDWSRLRTLTLLGCRNHEQLWKALRKRFTPTSRRRVSSTSYRASSSGMVSMLIRSQPTTPAPTPPPPLAASEYPLQLTRLHTDTVSPSLIAFIRDTLPPDTLEHLFLQETASYKSPVSIDTIYRSAIRRHRGSLTKLLVDSTLRTEDPDTPNTNWRRWVFTRELLTCITSGKMRLRELSMSIDYKDWHYFLRRLPNATTLRSLHIPHIAEHVNGTVHSREAALQILDIVALRPELELCYLGIQSQCFELLEYASGRKTGVAGEDEIEHEGGVGHALSGDDDEEDDGMGAESDFEAVSDMDEVTEDEGDGSEGKEKRTWRLREILFYDDKISIFKARHGRL